MASNSLAIKELNIELVVLDAGDEGIPLFSGEEDSVLRSVVRVPNSDAMSIDGHRHTTVDDPTRVGKAGLLKLRIFHFELEFHCQSSLCMYSSEIATILIIIYNMNLITVNP